MKEFFSKIGNFFWPEAKNDSNPKPAPNTEYTPNPKRLAVTADEAEALPRLFVANLWVGENHDGTKYVFKYNNLEIFALVNKPLCSHILLKSLIYKNLAHSMIKLALIQERKRQLEKEKQQKEALAELSKEIEEKLLTSE